LDLEFEWEHLEIETGLDAVENIDEIEKFTKIVRQSLRLVAKTRMCHHLEDLQQHRYCGTRQLASVEFI
jgi:inhibitor of KinA sporulation pathway (predicted exonuclease)